MPLKICLIVDNPLRDLDGMVLLAWQLVQRGADVWLVPMYEQGFDVFAIKPDWVVVNYVRPNNLDLLRLYRRAGIRLCVLDTEGAGGKTAEEFATMVGKSGGAELIDLYCVWGDAQYAALVNDGKVAASALHLTGCPRYDFCAEPWRNALPVPEATPGYILINTNFPVVNPRFSSGHHDEKRSMVQAGFSADFADAYIRDARLAHAGIVELLAGLLRHFPDNHFILRPHPFESAEAYSSLKTSPNFEIRQEGTSIEWINKAALLIHLNCSTAIEATMLGKEAVSPAWLDTEALKVPVPSQVSRHAQSIDKLVNLIEGLLTNQLPPADEQLSSERNAMICKIYHAIDGKSAARVADAILTAPLNSDGRASASPPSLRGRVVHWSRRILGHAIATKLRQFLANTHVERQRQAKHFGLNEVNSILVRLAQACSREKAVIAQAAIGSHLHAPRMLSGKAIHIAVNATPKVS